MTDIITPESVQKLPLKTYDVTANLELARKIASDPAFDILGDELDGLTQTVEREVVLDVYNPTEKSLQKIFEDLIGGMVIADTLVSHILDRTFPNQEGEHTVNSIFFHSYVAIASDSIAHALEAARLAAIVCETLDGHRSRPIDTGEHREEVNT